jgi:hypothetical protein
MTTVNKEEAKAQVSQLKDKVSYDAVNEQATTAISQKKNAIETAVGDTVGSIKGGVESISARATDIADKLNTTTVEGLITDGMESIKGSIDDTLAAAAGVLTSTFGTKLELTWTDPDEDGNVRVRTSSLVADTNSTLSALITLISGLGAGKPDLKGFAQEVVTNASPEGLVSSLNSIKGTVAGFPDLATVNALSEKANSTVADITAKINAGTEFVDAPNVNSGDSAGNFAYAFPTGETTGNITSVTMQQSYNAFDIETGRSVTDAQTLVDKAISIDEDGLKKDLAGLKNGAVSGSSVFSDTQTVGSSVTGVGQKALDYVSSAENAISNSKNGLIQGFVADLNQESQSLQKDYPELSDEEAKEVVELSQGGIDDQIKAAEIVQVKTKQPANAVRARLLKVNTTIAGTTVVGNEQSAFNNPFDFERNNWNDGKGNNKFSYVNTVEELEAELRTSSRDITEVVVHWSETFTNKNIGAEEINSIHLGLGLKGIGYHYVIRRDGSLQRGRPLSKEGDHSSANEHDKYSIGLVFVGGFNCASGTPNPETFLSSQSLTRAQMTTFEQFCRAFYKRYPGGQLLGHNDIDLKELDPGFDVIDYCKDVFGKESVFTDPATQKPFKPSDLIKQKVVS